MKRISIAILGTRGIPAAYGGFETLAQEMSRELSRRGFEVYVSCESIGFEPKRIRDYDGVRLVYFPILQAVRNLAEPFLYDTLSAIWSSFRVDLIVMLGCYFPVSLLLPRLMNKIVVVNVDGLEWNRRKFGPVLRFLLKQVEKLNAKISSQVIVDSRLIGRYYDLNYGISSVYIPNGIREIKPLEEKWLKRFGLVKNDYYLVLARLEPENNVDMIIREFKNSSSEKKLAIVGPLTNSGYVKQLLGYKDDSVVFLGGIFEPRLQRMLRHNCFAYIHGHEVGGANPSLIEALSCNNLILALDCSYNREVGEDAAIYFKKDPGDLREKIVDLERSEDCERSIRSRPYSVYLRKYTVEKMVDGFEELVRTLMHGH